MINVTPLVELSTIDNAIDFVRVYPDLAVAAIEDRWNARIKPHFLDERLQPSGKEIGRPGALGRQSREVDRQRHERVVSDRRAATTDV